MINFNVTKQIFEDVKEYGKIHEYREYKPYWIKRLSNINPPIMGNVVLGYSKIKIPITIVNIEIIETEDIINRYYKDFIKTKMCFDIEFKKG